MTTGAVTAGLAYDVAGGARPAFALPGSITFPLSVSRSVLESQPLPNRWCFAAPINCHHDYNAADIFAPTFTPVVSPVAGTVIRATIASSGSGTRVQIRDEQRNVWYLAHMHDATGLQVRLNERVERGTPIGFVGTSAHAQGTSPHLHIDVVGPDHEFRPDCDGGGCTNLGFMPVQGLLRAAPIASGQAASPAIVTYGNEIHVFVTRSDRRVFQRRWNPTTGWSIWFDLEGGVLGQPEAVVLGNQIHLFVTGTSGRLYEKWFNPTTGWTTWIDRGGAIHGEPSPLVYGNEIHVFVTHAVDRGVYQLVRRANGVWEGWFPLGGSVNGEVNPLHFGNRIHLFVAGWDRHVYEKLFVPGSGWTGWSDRGGQILGMPWSVAQGGRIHVFATGVDLRAHETIFNPGGWTGWNDLAGGVTGDPIPLVQGNALNVFVTGVESRRMFQKATSTPGAWPPNWFDLGGQITGSAKAFMYGADVHLFVIGVDRRLHQKVWNATTGWSPSVAGWHDLGGGIG